MQGKILRNVRWWAAARVAEPSSWVAAAAILMGFSFMLTMIWLMWVAVAVAIGGLVLKERGNA